MDVADNFINAEDTPGPDRTRKKELEQVDKKQKAPTNSKVREKPEKGPRDNRREEYPMRGLRFHFD